MEEHDYPGGGPGELASPTLQKLVDGAKRDLPSAEQLSRLAQRLGPVLGAGAAIGAGTAAGTGAAQSSATASAARSALTLKIAGAALVTGAAIMGGVWFASRPSQPPAPSESSTVASPAAQPAPSRSAESEPSAPAAVPEPPLSAPPVETAAPAVEQKSSARAPKAQPRLLPAESKKATSTDEVALLRAAQAAVKSDPEKALRLTQEHRRQFPNGVLTQEREVIAIEALARLGREHEATSRARDFNQQYPGSAHSKKVESETKTGK